ncbi:hypothetical protein Dimus_023431 [Dionaea muscipula]
MGTAILQSQDCLAQTLASTKNADYRSNPQRSRCRKRNPADKSRSSNQDGALSSSSSPLVEKFPSKGLVIGQVKILKRGEGLDLPTTTTTLPNTMKETDDGDGELVLCSTDRLGPDPEVVQKVVRLSDPYAGSTVFFSSPPPSSLPFPAALVRSGAATIDLRRMLKI